MKLIYTQINTKDKILNILSKSKTPLNYKKLEKKIGITHRAMWEHIELLEKGGMVYRKKLKINKQRKELKILLTPKCKKRMGKIKWKK